MILSDFFTSVIGHPTSNSLQILQNKIRHFLVQLRSCLSAIDSVVFVWVSHKFKLFFVLN